MASHSRRFKVFSPRVFLILFSLLLVSSRFIPPLAQAEDRVFHAAFSPVLSFFNRAFAKTGQWMNRYLWLVRTERENENLKAEAASLKLRLFELEEERRDTERLRQLLQFSDSVPDPKVFSRVMAYDPIPDVRSVLIDKGSDAGVQKGQGVISVDGVVGVVVKTTPRDAAVRLLVDPRSSVASEVRPSGARGVVQGQMKSLGLDRRYWIGKMEYLGVSEELHDKDEVVTSGLDRLFPSGIPVGRIEKWRRDEGGLFLSAEILPAVDFSKLKEVIVVQNENPPSPPFTKGAN
jgi:rod shape-determining protein MreC